MDPPFEQSLQEALALLGAQEDSTIIVVGDLNGRTASHTATTDSPMRQSPDLVAANQRGRSILQWAADNALEVVNGTEWQTTDSLGRFTSHQPAGLAVVDYVLVSMAALRESRISSFHVGNHNRAWSDHAPLLFSVQLRADISRTVLHGLDLSLTRPSQSTTYCIPSTEPCNALVEEALQRVLRPLRMSLDEKLDALYGTVLCNTGSSLNVWIAGVKPSRNRSGSKVAGAGVYFGPFHPLNASLSVTPPKSAHRAEVTALLIAITTCSPQRALHIFTTSTWLIHAICHWAPRFHQLNWEVMHGDLLRLCADYITERDAPLTFHLSDGSGERHNINEALLLANLGCSRDLEPVYPNLLEWRTQHTNENCEPPSDDRKKVYTVLKPIAIGQQPTRPQDGLTGIVEPDHLDDPGIDDFLSDDDRDDDTHPSRTVDELQAALLDDLMACPTEAAFWKKIATLLGRNRVQAETLVEAQQLRDVFASRTLPAPTDTSDIDSLMRELDKLYVNAMPQHTLDPSTNHHFSRPFHVDEIRSAKVRLRESGNLSSSKGVDKISYKHILEMDDVDLCTLLQTCIDERDAPREWLSTIMTASAKKGKDGRDPQSYRNIGLESCLLKFLTLLIDRRLRDWADELEAIPPNQNGFRTKHRPSNNVFTLRAAIEDERRRSGDNGQLWVAFVDLTNAFPSVDQAVLWAKLSKQGVGGPMIDWMRMIYSRMQYIVRHGGDFSEPFQCLAGILIGDPASPILWNLFLADFDPPPHLDDVFLENLRLSYKAQADDLLLLARTREGLQSKLDALERWCKRNGCEINVSKTVYMIFGPLPRGDLSLFITAKQLTLVAQAKYVGITLTSTQKNIFVDHRKLHASAARRIANVTLSLDSYIGSTPPQQARTLYMAFVDPHLIYGCEIDLGVDESTLKLFDDIQNAFIRRVLMLSSHSMVAILHICMRLWPIRYRRALIALRYLRYLVTDAPLFPKAALRVSIQCALQGSPSWWGDLYHALQALPVPVNFDLEREPTPERVDNLIRMLGSSLETHLTTAVQSVRLSLFKTVFLHLPAGQDPQSSLDLSQLLKMPSFLTLRKPVRKPLLKLFASEHPYAVQVLRYGPTPIRREWRICRFCPTTGAIEDESHILWICLDGPLLKGRQEMWDSMETARTAFREVRYKLTDSSQLLHYIMRDSTLTLIFARFVQHTFDRCEEIPPLRISNETQLAALHGPGPAISTSDSVQI